MTKNYIRRLAETVSLRTVCAPSFLPLFDHALELAADSMAQFEQAKFSGRSYLARRAGRELAHARKVASYTETELSVAAE